MLPVAACFIVSSFAQPISEKACNLKTAMRKLWSDHVIWTRVYIIAAVANAPDQKPALQRLLKNQDDIGNAVAGYYGKEAGNALAKLLKEHIELAGKVVAAAAKNNKGELKEANDLWYKNAQDIAAFLHKANPNNWSEKDLEKMLDEHLKLTTDEAVARIQKNWSADIQAFDEIYNQILSMADALTNGIKKQFPNKF